MNKPANHGRSWDLDEYEQLVEAIRDGLSLDEAADQLERTPGAVDARADYLILGTLPEPSAQRSPGGYERAFTVLSDPDYEWMEVLLENIQSAGQHLWDAESDSLCASAWADRSPALEKLAASFGVSVASVVRRFVDLGYGDTTEAVRARFGMKTRRSNRSKRPWTLLITTGAGRVYHVSQHLEQWDAVLERDSLMPNQDAHLDVSVTWRWEIVWSADPDEIPWAASRGTFHPDAAHTLGSEFIDDQLTNGGFKVMWGELEGGTAPVFMCPTCASLGLWSVEMHSLAASPDGSEKTDVYLRCLRGHEDCGSIPNAIAGEWLALLPQVPQDTDKETAPGGNAHTHSEPAGGATHVEVHEDDIDIADEDFF
ncbi:hypothetical protein QNM97_23675 [Gordonia sp. L191]|uniref:hypothetical protein n=1 Tax=Gordonia sp. L191 TaxID=2982699 RepID=UPI0024C04E7F|nr:hypothetical protein [Gordonia sp. L191]WHU46921.1 hypothetical protein QNM97_23675 [Gordonia sp. L191]